VGLDAATPRRAHALIFPMTRRLPCRAEFSTTSIWESPGTPYFRSATAGEQNRSARLCPSQRMVPACVWPSFGAWAWPATMAARTGHGTLRRMLAGMTDWQIPILRRLNLSGEFYRGRAVGGLGAAIGQTIVYVAIPTSLHQYPRSGFRWRMDATQISTHSEA